jgi:hypothetical protein
MREVTKLVKSVVVCGGLALVAGTLVASSASATGGGQQRADLRTDWNNSPDPNAIYGGCLPGGSALASKAGLVAGAGVSLGSVLAITVLDCQPFGSGPYPTPQAVVPCPAGSPYAVCVGNNNDGLGNAVLMGVLKRNTVTGPYQRPTGCPNQSTSKMDLLLRAGEDPRLINGIVTLNCGPASGSTAIERVPCPDGPDPYAYCLATGNDGRGNAVTLGVVAANGPADRYGLYGECNNIITQNGFLPKSSLVIKAGQSLNGVTGIELIGCGDVASTSGPLRRVSCDSFIDQPAYIARFAYCIVGEDEKNNGIAAGVRE